MGGKNTNPSGSQPLGSTFPGAVKIPSLAAGLSAEADPWLCVLPSPTVCPCQAPFKAIEVFLAIATVSTGNGTGRPRDPGRGKAHHAPGQVEEPEERPHAHLVISCLDDPDLRIAMDPLQEALDTKVEPEVVMTVASRLLQAMRSRPVPSSL